MFVSGLVSLNVHEALAFDGTEICLHPDLFANSNSSAATPATRTSLMSNKDPRLQLNPTMTSQEDSVTTLAPPSPAPEQLKEGDMIEIRVWDPRPGVTSPPRHTAATTSTTRRSNNVASIMRKRNSVPLTSAAGNNNNSTTPPVVRHTIASSSSQQDSPMIPLPLVSSSSVPTSPNGSNDGLVGEEQLSSSQIQPALSAPEVTTTRRSLSSTTNHSLQYSTGTGGGGGMVEETPKVEATAVTVTATTTPSSSQVAKDSIADALSVSSLPDQSSVASSLQAAQSSPRRTIEQGPPMTTLTTSNSTSLPPVFPRSRADTADSTSGPTTTAAATTMPNTRPASKPPRRRSNEPQQQQASSKIRPKHVREISDMTVETAAYAAASSDDFMIGSSSHVLTTPPHQPRLLSSPDDDDDDVDDEGDEDEDATKTFWKHLSRSHSMRLSFVMLVTKKSLTSLNRSASRTQVSLLRKVADLYGLSTYDKVTIHKIDPQDQKEVVDAISVDFLVVTIKDQFCSRGDMHLFQESLIGNWVYEGQRLYEPTRGHQAYAREIRHGDHQARSGIVTDQTTITFRSRSARFIWLVQISSEMYDYASPYQQEDQEENRCDIYFDKLITFLRKLFSKWKELEVTHSLTVVFFSRTFVGTAAHAGLSISIDSGDGGACGRDVYGRNYEDHFRIIIENETVADWDSLIVRIKEAFVRYPSEVGWNLETGDAARRPSSASQGNVLEAINVSLNLLQYHYLDRDLHRTGNSLFVISAGNGIMEVDKGLAGITYQRMMDNGIGSDMLSLGLPPLHIAPFFLYVNMYQQVETVGVDAAESYYEVPHWMNLSFVSYDSDNTVLGEGIDNQLSKKIEERNFILSPAGLPVAPNGFLLPRSKAKTEHEQASTSPLLRPKTFSVHGNAASSPVKKPKPLTQERQLIAGRDFQDILEACRPRHTNVLPSALQALIEIHTSSKVQLEVRDDTGREEASAALGEGRRGPLEWGSLDTSDATLLRGRSTSLGQGPSSSSPISPRFVSAMTPPKVDELDFVEKSSQSSSFASQVSSYLLGVSFDRPFLSPQGQLQRCPSLDVCVDEEQEASLESIEASDETRVDQHSIESLRKAMRSLDSVAATVPSSPLLMTQTDHPSSQTTEVLSVSKSKGIAVRSGQPGHNRGGIGAALTQYRASTAGTQSRNDIATDGPAMQRISSTPGLSGISLGSRQFSDVVPRGLSPLLLPPVLSFRAANSDQPLQDPRGALLRDPTSRRGSGTDLLNFPGPFVPSSTTSKESRRNHQGGFSLSSTSPPTGSQFFVKNKQDTRISQKLSARDVSTRNRPSHASRRKKAFNPFRQEDEDQVLATNSHNRRRWSHVFAMGELEFKRRNGPNIKSLTAPAILPLFVGYFPTQSEIDHAFTFSITNITLTEFDRTYYSSNKDLLMEMVRQRLTQDFQLVPPSHVNASNLRRETLRSNSAGTIRQFLSMGHRLQVLTYDPGTDIIEITRYDLKKAQSPSASETVKYHYLCFCAETGQYVKVVQNFEKYPSSRYNWNKVDRIICGDEDREMREGMRFRRIMFGLIPPDFHGDVDEEQAYIAKFVRLLEYLNKLREKDDSGSPELDIKVVSSADRVDKGIRHVASSTPGIARNSMKRFYVELSKGKRGSFEWMEVVVDSTFDTSWSYRIMFHWLVASSNKVDAQVQLLQRRCNQYGLDLKRFPQITVSRNVFVNPFKSPYFRVIRDKDKIGKMDERLSNIDFIHDGVFYTNAEQVLDCLGIQDFDLRSRRWGTRSSVAGKQFVHRTGTLFVRLLSDQKNCMVIIAIGNYLLIGRNPKAKAASQRAFRDLIQTIDFLENDLSSR